MRFSNVAPLVLAAAPSLVAAAGTMGFALGTKLADGTCKYQKDYVRHFVQKNQPGHSLTRHRRRTSMSSRRPAVLSLSVATALLTATTPSTYFQRQSPRASRSFWVSGKFSPGRYGTKYRLMLQCRPDVQESYDEGVSAIQKYYDQYKSQIYAITVGSETLV